MKQQSIEALGGIPLDGGLLMGRPKVEPDGTATLPMKSAGVVLADIASNMVVDFIEDMSQPAARAGFTASLLTSMLCSRARLGFLPSVAIAVMVGVSVEHLYGMAEDIHEKLTVTAPQASGPFRGEYPDAPGKV